MRHITRQVLLFFVCLFILTLNVCVQTQPDTPLKTMSFNVRYDNPNDGLNVWENRKDLVARTIVFHSSWKKLNPKRLIYSSTKVSANKH